MKNIWYIDFPTYRYEQDVKSLARKNNLVIVNSFYKGNSLQAKNCPKLTLKKEYIDKIKIIESEED